MKMKSNFWRLVLCGLLWTGLGFSARVDGAPWPFGRKTAQAKKVAPAKEAAPVEEATEAKETQIVLPDEIASGKVVTVSFPEAMIPVEDIGVESKPNPLRSEPALPGTWIWKSQTEGTFVIGETVLPGQEFKFYLKKGVRDLAGTVLSGAAPLGSERSPEFTVSTEYEEESPQKRQSVGLEFSYSVRASEVAETTYFQDRDNRRKYPVEVVIEGKDEVVKKVLVSPRDDLPKGRTFDLIVDGVKEAKTGVVLPEIFVLPIGTAKALAVEKVTAFNRALEKPWVMIDFNDNVDPEEGRKIRFEPPVKGLHSVKNRHRLEFAGEFDPQVRYKVIIPTSVLGERGYPLKTESRWGATFHAKTAAIIFPDQRLVRRSAREFKMPLIQVNAGTLKWRLAAVPPEKFVAIEKRLREFDEALVDPLTKEVEENPETGFVPWTPTELLINASRLEVLAEGSIPASAPDVDTPREIQWKPGDKIPSGPCLLEVTGTNAAGKTIGNRTLVTFTEVAVLSKKVAGGMIVRASQLSDGKPLVGIQIRAVTAENEWREQAVTAADGSAFFAAEKLNPKGKASAQWFLLETAQGLMVQPVSGRQLYSQYSDTGVSSEPGQIRMALVTDRPLYRPEHTVKFKGFLREVGATGAPLKIRPSEALQWRISRVTEKDSDREAVGSGDVTSDEFGGFDGQWKIPSTLRLGHYRLSVTLKEQTFETIFNIQEFRPPPFTVALSEVKQPGAVAGVKIQSNYFHGAPNSGARVKWRATWSRYVPEKIAETNQSRRLVVTDQPRKVEGREDEVRAAGEGQLSADGSLELKVPQPFTDGYLRGWYTVNWVVEVTGTDGQTITEPAEFQVYAVPVALCVEAEESAKKTVLVTGNAYDSNEQPVAGVPVTVQLFHVVNKSVKEQIAPHVFRYLNTTLYEMEVSVSGVTPFKQEVGVKEQGEYVVALRSNPEVPPTCRKVDVSGDEFDAPAQFAQTNETTFPLEADKARYLVGDTASLSAKAPFAGVAWVSVEANGTVLDSFAVTLEGNSGRIALPIKATYFPNVWVNLHLLRPGGSRELPAERFAEVKLEVERPELDLKVLPVLARKEARPGQPVAGEIVVTSLGKPVAGADVTVYAVDEAILVAGGWSPPVLLPEFYPARAWGVSSFFSGLDQLSERIEAADLTQKGFILGDGGDGSLGPKKPARKQFLPLAFWKTGLRTGADGKVAFSFKAPDSLTRYRVAALVQTHSSQFGFGSDAVEISKPVQIEPALPRFVRSGDEVELRAIVRQKVADSLEVTVKCKTSLKLEGTGTQTLTVLRNEPAVFRFPAKVGDVESATVFMETAAGPGDAVELVFPVHPPTLLRKEAVFKQVLGAGSLQEELRLPKSWGQSTGKASVMLSTSPWLPKLTGLPLLLEYPHGCIEQISSRILGYTVLGDLLAFVPSEGAGEYRKRVEDGLQKMNAALTAEGELPYWPGGPRRAFTSILGCWAAKSAAAQGWTVPSRLLTELPKAVDAIAQGKSWEQSTELRCMALLVLSEDARKPDAERLEPTLRDLYQRREKYHEESRAFLAMAMHQLGVLAAEKEQLLREIDRPVADKGFDPDTFSSFTRTEAIRAWAFATASPNTGKAREELRARIEEMLDSARSLSTQENFWLLLAFRAMHSKELAKPVTFSPATPLPTAVSSNKATALWTDQPIKEVRGFAPVLQKGSMAGLSCLVEARFRMQSADLEQRTDHGFRIERVVENHTDPARNGSEQAPYWLGDELVITVRLISPKRQHYVAVEGELPGCLESVNPQLASVARSYQAPVSDGERQLNLSYSEMRDRTTCLYFDLVDPGVSVYSTRARVTSAGTFQWPPTQAVPMYDSRYSGVSAPSVCHVRAEH